MPFSARPLRYLSRNEVFNTGDRCASPLGLRGSSRHRTGPPNDAGSPGSLLSPKSKNTGLRLSTQSRSSAHLFNGSANVSGLSLTIGALASNSKKRDLAFAPEDGLRFSTFSVNEGEFEFHLCSLQWPIDCSKRAASRRRAKS